MLPLIRKLGLPQLVQTEDDGHFWQWSQAGGLDREIITDDDLNVKSVMVALVATASPSPSPGPSDMPLLDVDETDAVDVAAKAGATHLKRSQGSVLQWDYNGSVLVAELANGRTLRIRGIDATYARALGYFGPPSPAPVAHHAPALVHQYLPPYVPPGAGTVIVRVSIDDTGKVTNTQVVLSSGDVAVDAFEQESMRRSVFTPATCAGAPCAGIYIDDGGLWR